MTEICKIFGCTGGGRVPLLDSLDSWFAVVTQGNINMDWIKLLVDLLASHNDPNFD